MISVIIPALNEEGPIVRCLGALRREDESLELIVADGGSTDQTIAAAEECGARVVRSEKGRGLQMNAGAAASAGDILLFLHADTVLETGWRDDMLGGMQDDGVIAGAFTFRVDAVDTGYRILEHWVRLRCAVFSLPYGDQGLFMRRKTFLDLGGFREIPLMEDVDMATRLKRLGRLTVLRRRAVTHARRWQERGLLKASAQNHLIMLLYRCGVDPGWLARLYYGKR